MDGQMNSSGTRLATANSSHVSIRVMSKVFAMGPGVVDHVKL